MKNQCLLLVMSLSLHSLGLLQLQVVHLSGSDKPIINHGTPPGPQQISAYVPSCSSICEVQLPWPGCGKPANEKERLAATEKLQLLGKEPQPALQRYVDLLSTIFEV